MKGCFHLTERRTQRTDLRVRQSASARHAKAQLSSITIADPTLTNASNTLSLKFASISLLFFISTPNVIRLGITMCCAIEDKLQGSRVVKRRAGTRRCRKVKRVLLEQRVVDEFDSVPRWGRLFHCGRWRKGRYGATQGIIREASIQKLRSTVSADLSPANKPLR